MDHNLDLLRRQIEQIGRFHYLKPFVEKRGGINRDLFPHVPGRMRKRFFRRNPGKLFPVFSPKWPAGRGEDQLVDLVFAPVLQALEDRALLAVHGQDLTVILL
ncbi:hypothetical protein SDC9_131146 [bioreactor metagenome]|uniref:Uncharacterized protein n=1 Tax=bioreactor metagenome TaxID=1076179 RepID=A0A645D4E5_9ZZZZ